MPRFFCPVPLSQGAALELPQTATRHVQVLRLQPGDEITLFDGSGGEWSATIERMGRSDVAVQVRSHSAIEREAPNAIHLAVGMPANERMDWLVEKATELGVASIQPLQTAHSVLRLSGERAGRKQQHWRAIAQSACEQCGRNRVPEVHLPVDFATWLSQAAADGARAVLSLQALPSAGPGSWLARAHGLTCLSGPEGGLSPAEEAHALARGFEPLTLGPRVLRAETAAIAAVAMLAG